MTVQITVGQNDATENSGTVSASLADRDDNQPPMIEVTVAAQNVRRSVRLTIAEAEMLQSVLDTIIFDAAIRASA